ncbi:MAG: response regulator [Anaerolineae bacterium]
MPPIRVLLVDDHPLVRDGVARLLAEQGFQVVAEAGDGLEALNKARGVRPDLILMDVHMPRCDGLQATRLIKSEMPHIKIVMLTDSDEDHVIFEAIRSGADGYLLKSLQTADFFHLLGGITCGEAPLPRSLATRILEEFARQARKGPTEEIPGRELTQREREVLSHLVRGATNKEIAAALSITEDTVKHHLKHILEKLHLRNRVEVAVYALQMGLVNGQLRETERPIR